jgi:hypothetical protein
LRRFKFRALSHHLFLLSLCGHNSIQWLQLSAINFIYVLARSHVSCARRDIKIARGGIQSGLRLDFVSWLDLAKVPLVRRYHDKMMTGCFTFELWALLFFIKCARELDRRRRGQFGNNERSFHTYMRAFSPARGHRSGKCIARSPIRSFAEESLLLTLERHGLESSTPATATQLAIRPVRAYFNYCMIN